MWNPPPLWKPVPWAWSPMAKRLIIAVALAGLLVVMMVGLAFGADSSGASTGTINDVTAAAPGSPTAAEVAQELGHVKISMNVFYLIFAGALVFFMQMGFAMVETGFSRSKNAVHVVMTNFVIFAIGAIGYWAVGFAFQFGGAGTFATLGATQALTGEAGYVIGTQGFFLHGNAYDVAIIAMFFFQLCFMDTTATIPTGAMAERWKFSAFAIYGLFISMITYPIYGNWVWGGGWLAQLGKWAGLGHGVLDFAGSSVVHAVGGFAALAGAIVLGPRIGKFGKDGKPRAILGHNMPMAILGVIVLVFGWIGFNGGSTLSAGDLRFPIVIVNTFIAASFGGVASMLLVWKLWGKPDPSMTANGMLAGLVAITAPCAFVSPIGSAIIGIVAGVLVVGSIVFVERVMKVDDPVGAVSVHGVNGLWGVISLGLFADGSYGSGFNGVDGAVRGLFYGGGWGQLGAQVIAAVVAAVWAFGTMYIFFRIQKKVQGIRVTREEEMIGLDIPEMGVPAYPASPHL